MAQPGDTEIRPNHAIAWLDRNMAVRRNNETCKHDLASSANPDTLPSNERWLDIDNLIQTIDPHKTDEQGPELINNVLHMFIDEEKCMEFIDESRRTNIQVFLIASGQMGASIVPKIYKELSGRIYIFCGQRVLHDWTDKYSRHIEVYDDEKGVFAKVLQDIGIYYYMKSEEETSDRASVPEYLRWARRLIVRSSRLDQVNRDDYLKLINDTLTSLVAPQLHNSNNADDQMETSGYAHEEG
jgi:hypothetical protein